MDITKIPQYELLEHHYVRELESEGYLMRHKKTGARVFILENDDNNKVFNIAFRTVPTDSTGVAHIIEHTVLCGSDRYPVKDPFVELAKGSLNTFLNAMTYSDKTMYPLASTNDKDFFNLMSVYMDGVFHPNITKERKIFEQEGWHYEMDSPDGELTYNGVVYNEMKGAFSSADEILGRQVKAALYPDTTYAYESGGDPEFITDLTYESYLEFYHTYYHPSNSYIYLYGDLDMEKALNWMDHEYLSHYEKKEIDSAVTLQKPFNKMKEISLCYAASEDDDEGTYFTWSKVVSNALDLEKYLAFQVLEYVLLDAPGAPLKQALLDAGIGVDIYGGFEDGILQPSFEVTTKGARQEQREVFVETIEATLRKLAEEGLQKRSLLAGLNSLQFRLKEGDFGRWPKGLMYGLDLFDSWLYDENKPFIHVEAGETFEIIKKDSENGFFEKFIEDNIIGNNHEVVLSLVPKHGLAEEKEAKEAEQLAKYKATLSKEELEELVKQTKALKEYQDTPSSQKDLEKIPQLELKDITREPAKLYIDPKKTGGVDVIHHNMFTNGIAYIMMCYNCKNVPDELLPYIGLLSSVLGLMDTEKYTYTELTNEININCGGISTDAAIYTDNKDFDKCTIMYEVKGKVLYDNIQFVLDMMNEIIYKTKFSDYKRLKEIIAKLKSRMESTMTSAGHSTAMLAGMAQFSRNAYYSNEMRGYGFYELIQKLDSQFDELKEDIADKLSKLVDYIFHKENIIVSFTADDKGYDAFAPAFGKYAEELKKSDMPACERKYTPANVKTGYTSASQVQYVARCGNFRDGGYEYTGALRVLKVIFSYDYLWINVRVKGGAYGCMSGSYRNGDMYMVSYRDPNLRKTNDIYENAADYLEHFDVSDRDMVKFIIGTIGDMDTPMNPAAKGTRSFGAYICNTDYESLKKERGQVLDCNVERIRELAPLVRCAMDENYFCVVGSSKEINKESELFDKIQPLIKVQG